MDNKHYAWKPLHNDVFRVLELYPGSPSDVLSGMLHHVSREDSPDYETISYAWGNPAVLQGEMDVEGQNMAIPRSAFEALRQVRSREFSRLLWLDAVCIDQTDPQERCQQVSFMSNIFSRSSQNLIYLGSEDPSTESGLAIVEDITAQVAKQPSIRNLFYRSNGDTRGNKRPLIRSPYDDGAFHSLFQRPWFSRLWVLQEAALAPFNICFIGHRTVHLQDLVIAAAWYRLRNYKLRSRYSISFNRAVLMFDMIFQGYTDEDRRTRIHRPLDLCLVASRQYLAWEPRDYVFALRGLVNNLQKTLDFQFWELLEPDYQKSERQVFADATKAVMLEAEIIVRPLRKVMHSSTSEVTGRDIPSWAIRLGSSNGEVQRQANLPAELSVFLAGVCLRGSPNQLPLSHSGSDTLLAKGLLIDHVLNVGIVFRRSFSPKQICAFLDATAVLGDCHDIGDRSSENARKLAHVLTAGVDVARRSLNDNVSAVDQFFSWVAWVRSAAFHNSVELSADAVERAMIVHYAVTHACSARRLFRTESGFLGLGPKCMQERDQLVVLYEADTPCILRSAWDGGEACHHFVGSCYVHGIMEGEVFQRYGEEHHRHTFKLR